jgi:hypothetical protein
MSSMKTAFSRGFPASQRLRSLLLLIVLGAAWLVMVVLTASPTTHSVTLTFLCSTNDGVREVTALEITNRLPREIWWRIQTGGTNYPGSLTLESIDGVSYQSGVWHGIGQYSGEPPVKAHSSYRPFYTNPNVHIKGGERVWLVWSDQPKSMPIPHSALNDWRWSFSYFLDRHGWNRVGVLVRPNSNDPHVEELVAPYEPAA